MFALLRHIGNLRIWLREAGIIRDANTIVEEGPVLGAKIPNLKDILSSEFASEKVLDHTGVLLLIFVPPGMWESDSLIPAIKIFEQENVDKFQILLISIMPAVEMQFDLVREQGIRAPIALQQGWKIADTCNILTAPYALIVDRDYIVQAKMPVANEQGLKYLVDAYERRLASMGGNPNGQT